MPPLPAEAGSLGHGGARPLPPLPSSSVPVPLPPSPSWPMARVPSTKAAQLNDRYRAAYLGQQQRPRLEPIGGSSSSHISRPHEELFASPIWASEGSTFPAHSAAPLAGPSSKPLPPAPFRRAKSKSPERRPSTPPPPLLRVDMERWPATGPPATCYPPPTQHPSLVPEPLPSVGRHAHSSPPAIPDAALPPPPPPIPLPDGLDPYSQQEAYDRRSAALALAASSSVTSALPTSSIAGSSTEEDDDDQRRLEEAVRLSLAEAALDERRGRAAEEAETVERSASGLTESAHSRNRLAAYNHTPPLQDSKPFSELPSPVSAQPAQSAPSSAASGNSFSSPATTSFIFELRAHSEILSKLQRWQAGLLPASLEWHELVPPSVRLALDTPTAERQGLLWEIFRSEMEYVRNLEAGLNGFFTPLSSCPPTILGPTAADRQGFIHETFFNLAAIFPRHSRMVFRLQERQIEGHPVVDNIADVLIEALIDLLGPYEQYLKHYPYAEARVRKELASNKLFAAYINRLSQSPTVRKQDLLAFLVSPLSRLSKLELALAQLLKITPSNSDDALGLPVVLDQIRGMLRAVQPGVDAASNKVKAWKVGRKLRFRRGERNDINLDLEADERAVVKMGKVWRRQRNERDWHGWTELWLILFDNYLLITKEEILPGGHPEIDEDHFYAVVSRPVPLEFLAVVGSERDPGEHRRDMIVDYQRRKPFRVSNLLEPILQPDREIFPFHIEHAGLKKAYSLFVESEEGRCEWLAAIKDQATVRRVVLENNALYSISTLTYSPSERVRPSSLCRLPAVSRSIDGHVSPPFASHSPMSESPAPSLQHHATSGSITSMRSVQSLAPPEFVAKGSGAPSSVVIMAAAFFERFDKEMFMVADSDGLSVGYRDDSRSHRRLVESSSITDLRLLAEANSVIILATATLYSLDLGQLLPSADPDSWLRVRKDSGQTISAWGESVSGFRVGQRKMRPLVLYWCLNRLSGQSQIEVHEPVFPLSISSDYSPSSCSVSSFTHRNSSSSENADRHSVDKRSTAATISYRHVASGSAVGAVYDVTFRGKLVSIAIDKGFIILDPLHLSTSMPNVPTFPETAQLKPVYSTLKSRVATFQPLLMHWLDDDTAICVYETGCCWVDRQGAIAKSGAYITWESRATAAVVRGQTLILFARDRSFISVYDLWFGSLRQATEGDFRLVGTGVGNVLAVRGAGQLVELIETVALPLHNGV